MAKSCQEESAGRRRSGRSAGASAQATNPKGNACNRLGHPITLASVDDRGRAARQAPIRTPPERARPPAFAFPFSKGASAMWDWIQENFILWTIIMVLLLAGLVFVLLMVRKNQED